MACMMAVRNEEQYPSILEDVDVPKTEGSQMVLPPAWVRRAIQDRRALHDKAELGPPREYYKHSYLHMTTVTSTKGYRLMFRIESPPL